MTKTDPYFKPIVFSALIVLLLNTVLALPFNGAPLLTYFLGGVLSAWLFKKELKDEFRELTAWDAAVLGLGTGSIAGSILTLIISAKLREPEIQKVIVDAINDAMKMHSEISFNGLDSLSPEFYIILALATIFICCFMSLFGSLAIMPFVNKGKK